ncbi:MAG: hypothetical protein WKF78_06920 [Candidatus Limnocylindrales bacterium]
MSVTSEAPAAFRNAADDPGAARLIQEGLADIVSRRRLVRYLVQADMRKRGADTILGNFWWVLDPLLQMLVYVIFVTIIVSRQTPDYPLFIFAAILPWKWFTTSVVDATSAVASQDRLIKQIQFPKLVLPVATTTAGVVGFCLRTHPAGGADAVLRGPDQPVPVAHPAYRRGPVRVHSRVLHPARGRQRLLPRPRATWRAMSCACGGSSRRGCTAWRSWTTSTSSRPTRS